MEAAGMLVDQVAYGARRLLFNSILCLEQLKGNADSLRPVRGLRASEGEQGGSPALDSWLPENSTLIRLIVTGPEDPKLLGQRHSESGAASAKDELLVAFNSYPPVGADGKCGVAAASQMYLARNVDVVHPTQVKFGQHLSCGHLNRAEKNWIPFERNGKFYFVYSLLPHEVVEINPDGSCGKRFNSAFTPLAHLQAMDFDKAIRGSAQAVFIDDAEGTPNLPEPHFLAMLHITDTKVRRYAHFAYRFKAEPPFEIVQISKQLPLQTLSPGDMSSAPFAFVSGLAVRERQVVISYAAGDRDPRALLLKMERLDEMFASDEAGSEISS
ncbi:unnamed protein product [Polarella glacialis]|uniref:Uncharacterized protein n=1 Tax=Polarella glacialis TaxID=89957 RepID=A0A813KI86_POLGL|nr:unnamed protein product [Polarella glacialis]